VVRGKGITWQFILAGKTHAKRLYREKKGSIRRELLNAHLFYGLNEVRIMCKEWREGLQPRTTAQVVGVSFTCEVLEPVGEPTGRNQ
jgi:hypothetical protein